MHTAKYLIHADIRTSGVVERSDVVGAVFGQTEGLLGEELDLRSLQEASKVGRIDVEIAAEDGRSCGEITIATALDRVETAVLAAALETVDRVGPSRAEVTVVEIEDARAAHRRAVVDRATELLAEVDPRVADSDAIVVVEGRADVQQLLRFGIKNAVAVEGTDVPDAVAALTAERTVTAFLDGDRGGDLILRELAQVGDIDYVAFAPEGQSVEDLNRETAVEALRKKVPFSQVPNSGAARAVFAGDHPEQESSANGTGTEAAAEIERGEPAEPANRDSGASETEAQQAAAADAKAPEDRGPATLRDQVHAVIGEETDRVRLVDESFATLAEADATDAVAAVADAETVPATIVIDGVADQRLLDVAAQRGVGEIVATETGEYVKQPTSVRVRTAEQLARGDIVQDSH
ncbi:DNA primase [Halobacteriales archaeon QH_10_67_13]|nr:MAG: DNA primase [Halobacteriales archaeon QH_10_67_13]